MLSNRHPIINWNVLASYHGENQDVTTEQKVLAVSENKTPNITDVCVVARGKYLSSKNESRTDIRLRRILCIYVRIYENVCVQVWAEIYLTLILSIPGIGSKSIVTLYCDQDKVRDEDE